MSDELQNAVKVLVKHLREDEGYRISWVANIAVPFQNAFHEHHRTKGVHEISNIAANMFLDLLCYQGKEEEPK